MITTIYASVLAVFYVAMSVYIIKGRYQYGISLGDGENPDMIRRIRAHANFSEYVPFTLLMMLFAELEGGSVFFMHGLGLMFVTGRVVHAITINRPDKIRYGRQIGMVLTFSVLLIASLYGLIKSIF